MKKLVLAFSGGLDTSFCVKYLIEQGWEVHTALVNTGGFSAQELEETHQRAIALGSSSHKNLDITETYYQQMVKFLIFGNVLRNQTYPLSVSAERMFQAIATAEYAVEIGAQAVAHGSTGAGNDQVRFDLAFQILAPGLEIITPIRDLKLSRKEEIDYLHAKGVEWSWEKAKYSINKGLWGTSVGGAETLTSHGTLPEEAWPTQISKTKPELLEITFHKGEITHVNGEKLDPVKAIQTIEEIAGPFGIGRDIHVGDTIIGIKGRVGFEAAAALITIKAHHALEKHTMSKWQQHWKEQLGAWYGMMLHEGQYLDPVMRDIESFLTNSQKRVSGKVFIDLIPHHFHIRGVQSPYDLMASDFGAYGEMNNGWTADDAKGFIKLTANAMKIFHGYKDEA